MDETNDKSPEKNKDSDLQEVCRVFSPAEAEVVRSFLESQGIACNVRGNVSQYTYPLAVDGLAEFKVLVAEKDLELARELLRKLPEPEEPEK